MYLLRSIARITAFIMLGLALAAALAAQRNPGLPVPLADSASRP
jgi:hypothetical protein